MNTVEIQQCLQHRYPLLLVDRVTEVVPNEYIKGYKNLSINEGIFQGHFPDNPIFPGIFLIEALAQISGLLGNKSMTAHDSQGSVLLTSIDKTRFRKSAVPGDRVDLVSNLKRRTGNLWKFSCCATVNGVVVADSVITCFSK